MKLLKGGWKQIQPESRLSSSFNPLALNQDFANESINLKLKLFFSKIDSS